MKNTHILREAQQLKLLENRLRIITKIIKSKKLTHNFEPSIKILSRILKVIVDSGPRAKTSLSLEANLNYARLAQHIVWMEKKNIVKSTIGDNKISISLTDKGRILASTLTTD